MAETPVPPPTPSKEPIFRDIRRYYCDYCGISRSKKALIASHVLAHHKEEIPPVTTSEEDDRPAGYSCEECGACFRKPAYLKQHMQGHSLERPFVCHLDDCHSSYRRKDHLMRHMLSHEGKLFTCPIDGCKRQFAYQANMKRHVVEIHDDDSESEVDQQPKQYTCPEVGCGKVFKYPSKLKKHERSHAKPDHTEVTCPEPGCSKCFSNKECLKAHVQSCHMYIPCNICGVKQLKKNIKRHQRMHEGPAQVGKIKCSYVGCCHVYSKKSNLIAHITAVHLEERPFACRIAGCGKRFPFKHVRDKHETSGIHAFSPGDFLESDQMFRSRPRGGRKRKSENIDNLLRKRVAPSDVGCVLDDPSNYLRWLLDEQEELDE